MFARLHSDGGSRGNPGPAGAGFVLTGANGEVLAKGAEYLGIGTNNFAEYTALILGMEEAARQGVAELECLLDSELVVKQLNGEYRVKNVSMKPLYQKVISLKNLFFTVSFRHIPRAQNKMADQLVNIAMDRQKTITKG